MSIPTESMANDNEDLFLDKYIKSCKKFNVPIDPSICITLQTLWSQLKPTSSFSEGHMITLLDVLDDSNTYIKHLDFNGLLANGVGSGNSNARILSLILQKNKYIERLDISNSRLDDVGIAEISNGISNNNSLVELNISYNSFGSLGQLKYTYLHQSLLYILFIVDHAASISNFD